MVKVDMKQTFQWNSKIDSALWPTRPHNSQTLPRSSLLMKEWSHSGSCLPSSHDTLCQLSCQKKKI